MHIAHPTLLADQLLLTVRVALFVAVFIGLGFWLLGRRLARVTCAMVGLLAGLAVGMAIASTFHQREMAILVIAFCALGGMVLAWLLYRIWMSLSLAAALALVGPIALLAWQGTLGGMAPGLASLVGTEPENSAMAGKNASANQPSQPLPTFELGALGGNLNPDRWSQSIANSNFPMSKIIDDQIKKASQQHVSAGSSELGASLSPVSLQVLAVPRHILNSIYLHIFNHVVIQNTKDYFRSKWDWFENLSLREKHLAMLLAGCGALIGLLIGLLFPTVAASMVSALVGSLFMGLAGCRLLAPYLPPAGSQNSGPRAMLAAVSLITMLGIFVQWTMSRRPTDK